MSSVTSTFHISDPGPQELYEFLDTVEAKSPESKDELREGAQDLGHQIARLEKLSAGPVLARLGIVHPDDQFSYTDLGDELIDIMYRDRVLFNNLLHYLYYTAHERFPEAHIFSSFTYREITNYLYDNAPFESLHGHKGTIVGEVEQRAHGDDLDLSQTQTGISLSTKTINNYVSYIDALEPGVNPNGPDETAGFVRRSFCPPELFVMAVSHEYRRNGSSYNTLLRVTQETERQLKQCCLLSDEGFSQVIEYTSQAYPFFSSAHDFGLNLRLHKEVSFNDLE